MELERTALVARIQRRAPRIVALIAPAGFGKSTLARQLVAQDGAVGVCDCADVRNCSDFLRRLIPALAEETPARGRALSRLELILANDSSAASERVDLALRAWAASPTASSTVLFENVEGMQRYPDVFDVFLKLLVACPETRRLILCSREQLRVHLTRFVAPHAIATITADDLAFSLDEIRLVLESCGLGERSIERVFAVSQGWPIAVLLLARLSAEPSFGAILEQLTDSAFKDLHDYLIGHVLSMIDDTTARLLRAACALPSATPRDLLTLTHDEKAVDDFLQFSAESPFVTITDDGVLIVHPLMRAALERQNRHHIERTLIEAAVAQEEARDFQRAAELYLAAQRPHDAARVLECVPIADYHALSMRYCKVLASMERLIVQQQPTLWSCSALMQLYFVDLRQLLVESDTVWRGLTDETTLVKRCFVLIMRVLVMTSLGMLHDALSIVEDFLDRSGRIEGFDQRFYGFALYLKSTLCARLGRINLAERDMAVAWPLMSYMDAMASAALMIIGGDIARARGDRVRERHNLDLAIDYARKSQMANMVAIRIAEAAVGAWLAGEDELFERYISELRPLVEQEGVRGFRFFLDCAQSGTTQPTDLDAPRYVVFGYLIRSAESPSIALARSAALSALAVAKQDAAPLPQVLCSLAVLQFVDRHETAPYTELARSASARIDSDALQKATASTIQGAQEAGFLGAFIRRLRKRRTRPESTIKVHFATGSVTVGRKIVQLGDRELALLFSIARQRAPVSRDRLSEAIWPDHDEDAGKNAFNVCLHRLRQRFKPLELIKLHSGGYELSADVDVDLWRFSDLLSVVRRKDELSDEDMEALQSVLAEQLPKELPQCFLTGGEFLESIGRELQEMRREMIELAARKALKRGDLVGAYSLAEDLIRHDSCDEVGHEIAITALIRKAEFSAAQRHYRMYRKTLREELDCDPSPALRRLIEVTAGP